MSEPTKRKNCACDPDKDLMCLYHLDLDAYVIGRAILEAREKAQDSLNEKADEKQQ